MPRSVLHLIDDLKIGGAQRLVAQLSEHLAASGVPVAVCARGGGPLWDDLHPAVRRLPWAADGGSAGGRVLAAARLAVRLRRVVRARDVDVVHVHGRLLAIVAGLAVRGLRVTVVEHVHNTFPATRLSRALSFRGPHLIACGSAIATMLIEDFHRPPASVHTVLNGVPDGGPPVPVPVPSPADGGQERLRIVAVGALTPQKDPARFLRVAGLLHEAGRLDQAVWVGPGDVAHWRAAAAASGLAEVVRFDGAVPNARAHLDDAHLLLSTSRQEGLPLVALEALCAGRGVVLPDVGSCRDVLDAGPECGLLYAAGESDRTLADLLSAAAESGSPVPWGAAARATYERSFRLDAMLQRMDRLYDQVVRP